VTIYTLEVQAHTGVEVRTFYAADRRYTTRPDDTPPDRHFRPTIKDPGNLERFLFGQGSTAGQSSIGVGEVVLVNTDGRYDTWANFAFDGRPCIIKAIPVNGAGTPLVPYADAPVLVRGTVESVDLTDAFSTVRLRLYDRLSDLDRPLLTGRYAGTTIAAGPTAEGTADLAGTVRPRVYGTVRNVAAINVNPFDLIRQVSDKPCASIVVYDGGLALTAAADFSTIAALQAAAIAPGEYATALGLGLFRLGGAAAGVVTADVAAVGASHAAGIAQAMLLDAGMPAADLDAASFDVLTAANAAPCGYFVDDDRSVLQAVTDVLRSIGGWIVPRGDGTFQVGRLDAPAGPPVASFEDWQVRGTVERLAPSDSNRGVPAWRVVVRYGRLARTMTEGEIVGAVDATRRAALGRAYREAVAEDATIKTRHLMAPEMTFETYLTEAADAQAEAARLLAIYGTRRAIWRVRLDQDAAQAVGLGQVVSLKLSRALRSGARLVAIGRIDDCVNDRVQLDLWG
jgi:hypothetical protein